MAHFFPIFANENEAVRRFTKTNKK